jgi:hypothetical protein
MRKITAGEELCHSYISLKHNLNLRRKVLEEGFGFRCSCDRCEGDYEEDQRFLSEFLCRSTTCGGLMIPIIPPLPPPSSSSSPSSPTTRSSTSEVRRACIRCGLHQADEE